ncbi:SDR family NAD(P)-dependent oxidoreductase [Stackebrandtia nassauensis]|uniref:Short-chain dehydrogenase/reductase SDR n=1 Tax=Stackebrandtia nassauensis (strain DSM 44728 / CIP 108903 / NRRL B-16338 / NBRC 102104 / LLR-40K-21) TaxID=446470 RepID=D3Q346_STANL|nr:SDR family NAD(P)-dependent oxidoreductase [Stackebrandtia nassauensis]ADD40016.1 short-chain dehydrogenase/reductase SDR [Stackebrandtia nassauensis DSM 44728]
MTTVNTTAKPFDGKTVVVTGGAGGIGHAVSEAFTDAGAHVVTVDLTGADHDLDVTDAAALTRAMADVNARHGGPHVLVALAGGSLGIPRDLDAFTDEQFNKVLDVNVTGTLNACRAALPYLKQAKGSIVTCTSIGARQPSPVTGVAYAAAKAAIGGLTRRLAAEVGPDGVRVNALAPGLVLTPRLSGMFDGLSQSDRDSVTEAIALRRMPELREIVDPILFLAGEGAGYITGVTLDVNGGRYMPP